MSQTEVQLIKNGAVVDADINGMSSSKLSGALPAISGASLTNLPTPTGKARNLIINGAMQVAQRGTSSTSNDYLLDRWYTYSGSTSNTVTTSQVAITSGNAYDAGFRKAAKISLSGAGTLANTTEILFYQRIEAQDLANSGWNYKSASSFVTLSFWVKASTAQAYAAHLRTEDGTAYLYAFTYTVAQANVWQKITKTIPGNSNITIDDDNGSGLRVYVGVPAVGGNYDGATPDTWIVSANDKFPPIPSTWLTAGASTFELTGVQFEVGSVATDFEHRSFADEIRRCRRYFCKYVGPLNINFVNEHPNNTAGYLHFPFYEEMRASPTETMGSSVNIGRPQVSVSQKIQSAADISPNCFNVIGWSGQGSLGSTGDAYYRMSLSESDANSTISCNAEL